LLRKVLFSRSLRLLPLNQQVGVVEGLSVFVQKVPELFDLKDQHLLAFLSELLKMSSVADGEMTDNGLEDCVVDKNGFTDSLKDTNTSFPTHSSSLFFRRLCVMQVDGRHIVVPEELPTGIQLRVSTISLLHAVIRGHSEAFFDAEVSTPVGKSVACCTSFVRRSSSNSPSK
jgi:hypothetical protein